MIHALPRRSTVLEMGSTANLAISLPNVPISEGGRERVID